MPEPLDYREHDAPVNSPALVPQRTHRVRHFTRVAGRRIGIAFAILVLIWAIINAIFNR